MKSKDKWLNRMLDAALSDPPGSLKDPDFSTLRQASSQIRPFPARRNRRLLISAAAAALILSLGVPLGLTAFRQNSIRRLTAEQNRLFVEQLIGGSLFDEELVPDEPWIFDDSSDTANIIPFDI